MLNRLRDILGRIAAWPANQRFRRSPWPNIPENRSAFAFSDAMAWLPGAKEAERQEIAGVLAELMRKLQPQDWTRLYEDFRFAPIQPHHVPFLATLNRDSAVEMLGVATLNASGQTREAALKALAELRHPRAVPYALLRLGDWVFQVRETAVLCLRELMKLGIADQLLDHHDLIERLAGVQRVDLRPVVEELREYLRNETSRSAMLNALESERVPVRLFVYNLLADQLDRDLMHKAASDSEPSVRTWLARRLFQASPQNRAEFIVLLLRDRSSRVCTTIVSGLSRQEVVTLQPELLELAFADARPVREAVRYALRDSSLDFARLSRQRVLDNKDDAITPGVIQSLGETGNESDCELVRPFLASLRSRLREAAVDAIARLGKEQALSCIVPLLDDTSGRVRRAVVSAMAEANVQPWLQQIRSTLAHGSEGGQVQALQLLSLQGGWDILPDLLGALRSQFEKVRGRAWQDLTAWYSRYAHRGWLKPSKPVRARLKRELMLLEGASVEPPLWASGAWQELRRWLGEELRAEVP